ncbi:DUF2325 domain-containing protein [Saccharibacillus brassicae]|uniref:DUF2325 domain-containing protein n=1 Tax=Saccharibacillus brassicae TaxID=2583377 RepID=A0A4Y6URG5_SACBS|nr:DUF2325 domain-containing protein [Saccharibacillus brassicae]QDH19644.1 DUF2325 domain-containing protein [Saccharibacillus brassicae]
MKRIKPSAPAGAALSADRGAYVPPAPTEEQLSNLPLQYVPPLIREMNESAKRKWAQSLQFPFARRGTRKWPEALFAKSMLDLLAQARSSLELRGKLCSALLPELRPLLTAENPAFSAERFDEDPGSWTQKYGKWHLYWALYFQTPAQGEGSGAEEAQRRLERLASSEMPSSPPATAGPEVREARPELPVSGSRAEAAEQRRIDKLNRRIEALEQRCRKDEERARLAEKDAAELRRAAAREQERSARLEQELEAERRLVGRLAEEREAAAAKSAELKRQHKQERSRFEEELAEARRSARAAAIREAQAVADAERGRGAAEDSAVGGSDRAAGSGGGADRRADSGVDGPDGGGFAAPRESEPEETFRRFDELLRRDLREAGAALPGGGPGDLEARTHLRRALDLLDAVDAYAAGRRMLGGDPAALPGEAGTLRADDAGAPRPGAERAAGGDAAQAGAAAAPAEEAALPASEAAGDDAPALPDAAKPAEDAGIGGLFHRRDHGGYIVLDNGETFNITESMVYKHQLQHEAEVRCMPREDGHGGTQYEIELLFQGDDTFSPVRQYNGYVELGEHEIWYAVDMNDADRRYPIHAKDLDIQRPVDGAPCIFNVGEEESVARLARVYRDFSDQETLPRPSGAGTRQPSPSAKTRKEGRKKKPEPYLEGCTVVVLGGQRKWFEDVVVESGAAYVHENGERPDLVASDLRRAQALFLLITSTSHRASWEGIELAKASGVPYFIIQGSKSNLRSMLWDNREEIRQANRGEGKPS